MLASKNDIAKMIKAELLYRHVRRRFEEYVRSGQYFQAKKLRLRGKKRSRTKRRTLIMVEKSKINKRWDKIVQTAVERWGR